MELTSPVNSLDLGATDKSSWLKKSYLLEVCNFVYLKKSTDLSWFRASLVAQMVKNLPAMWETRVPSGLGRSPGEGKATYSSILAWRIPRTEKPGGLPVQAVELDTTEQLKLSLLNPDSSSRVK